MSSQIFLAVDAVFEEPCEGPTLPVINSQATSVMSLTLHLSAIAACLVFWRGLCHPAFSDFCNRICQEQTHAAQQTTWLIQLPDLRWRAGSAEYRGQVIFAVLPLITSWNFVGCSIGSSSGFAPCKILASSPSSPARSCATSGLGQAGAQGAHHGRYRRLQSLCSTGMSSGFAPRC